MSAFLPFTSIDSSSLLSKYFTTYQICWIQAEDPFHQAKQRVFTLAEKSVRIGWTFADGFKNVRKRLRFPKRDYLFVTRDWPSALEYMRQTYDFAELLGYTRAVLSHGEDLLKLNSPGPDGHPASLTDEIKIGYIKFDNGSRIIAFSSNPYAMAVYGGDVGLDEFAKHPNAKLLWQTAQARVTWNYDCSVWSSHDGEDTLFNQFALQARAQCAPSPSSSSSPSSSPPSPIENQKSKIENPSFPWTLYFRVTMPDALQLGLLDLINRTQGTNLTPEQFLADCQARSGSEETFQQSYMCNPLGAASASIVEWSAIERCREDYPIQRLHLEHLDIQRRFGEFQPHRADTRQSQIHQFLRDQFSSLFPSSPNAPRSNAPRSDDPLRLGFDVAASGHGDLAAIYIDQAQTPNLYLRALFTCRTEDWHFLKTVLFFFLKHLPNLQAAGDESGLGRQICWEAAEHFSSRFLKVNLASKKHDLGFALMNQLSIAEKRFPRSHQDIAADFFALRKAYTGSRWIFTEARNSFNPASHCDIAWAAALASHAHSERRCEVGAAVIYENGYFDGKNFYANGSDKPLPPEAALLWSDDPRIWHRVW